MNIKIIQGLFKDFQGHVHSHFSRNSLSAKKSLESNSFLVPLQHEQFYPAGLSVFAGLNEVSTKIQIRTFKDFQHAYEPCIFLNPY